MIESAYRALLKRYHPDVAQNSEGGEAERRAKEITEAYGVLKNPATRARYDQELASRREQSHSTAYQANASAPAREPEPPSAPARRAILNPTVEGRISAASLTLAVIVLVGAIGSLTRNAADTDLAQPEAPAQSDELALVQPDQQDQPLPAVPKAAIARSPQTYSPSFECAYASNPAEAAICTSEALSAADRELAVVYAAALKTSADPGALESAQRRWLESRNSGPPDVDRLLQSYADRIRELNPSAYEPIF